MLNSEFFLFVGVAIFSYGIQAPLLAYFTRKYSSVMVVVYRNLFLAFLMLPIFFFVTREDVTLMTEHIGLLLLASFSGVVALIFNLNAFRYLPVAMSNILRQVSDVVLAIVIGAVFLGEYLAGSQLLLLGAIICCGVILALTRLPQMSVLVPSKKKGVLLAVLAGFSHALSFFFFTKLVRVTDPLVAAYFWEVFIGIFAAAYMLILMKRKEFLSPVNIPLRTALPIAFASLVTISGTLAYGYAVEHGPYALASGLITSSIVVVLLTSRFFLKEKLAIRQIALMLTIVVFMIILRMTS